MSSSDRDRSIQSHFNASIFDDVAVVGASNVAATSDASCRYSLADEGGEIEMGAARTLDMHMHANNGADRRRIRKGLMNLMQQRVSNGHGVRRSAEPGLRHRHIIRPVRSQFLLTTHFRPSASSPPSAGPTSFSVSPPPRSGAPLLHLHLPQPRQAP